MLLKKLSLLFVEDDSVTREQLRHLLAPDVRQFFEAGNGREALEIYHKEKPDIILTDLSMPEMGGLEMIREIRKLDMDQVILILSARNDRETLFESVNASVDGFLIKPILDFDRLYAQLERAGEKAFSRRHVHTVTGQKQMVQLFNKANRDPLTRLYNRYYFQEKLESLCKKGRASKSTVLFFLDLDDFKEINDTYGHRMGDMALRTIAKRYSTLVPDDSILARIGGDEFSLILPGKQTRERLTKLAKTLLEATHQPIELPEGGSLSFGCSIGISRFPEDAETVEELIHHADLAMYRAKKSGKYHYAFYQTGDEEKNG